VEAGAYILTAPDLGRPFLHCPVCGRSVRPTGEPAPAPLYRCTAGHGTDAPVVRYAGDRPFMSYPTEVQG
jgi:hypothetical protein